MAFRVLSPLRGRTITHVFTKPFATTPRLTSTAPRNFFLQKSASFSSTCNGSFDICAAFEAPSAPFEARKDLEMQQQSQPKDIEQVYLRPGMVLLKNFVGNDDQINILKQCRELGIGPGGFYRPTPTSVEMRMCLGMIWDARAKQYAAQQLFEGEDPLVIPEEFKTLVQTAIETSHELCDEDNVSIEEIPAMVPDIGVVSFYKDAPKKRVLHQDKYESDFTITYKGSPVVSICIGDSAKFVYGDSHNVDKAKKVIVESGDVIMFGGPSRRIYHGISIIHGTTPRFLAEKANLRRGLLNLTFKEY
ncbi:hypothetical protein GIB67_011571 [Kingdonia uniflora]|uniref:Alpha-ketoglutarate-dependent dioxygenase AlkB-like domain-containing protein n=1 Tax=Kingdonia uniflora TaxID=39325 RepID=A0A7J7NM27_9MAGN|nr:hypothetical protein GIB67_011571 [Kingdonia uniflora]